MYGEELDHKVTFSILEDFFINIAKEAQTLNETMKYETNGSYFQYILYKMFRGEKKTQIVRKICIYIGCNNKAIERSKNRCKIP